MDMGDNVFGRLEENGARLQVLVAQIHELNGLEAPSKGGAMMRALPQLPQIPPPPPELASLLLLQPPSSSVPLDPSSSLTTTKEEPALSSQSLPQYLLEPPPTDMDTTATGIVATATTNNPFSSNESLQPNSVVAKTEEAHADFQDETTGMPAQLVSDSTNGVDTPVAVAATSVAAGEGCDTTITTEPNIGTPKNKQRRLPKTTKAPDGTEHILAASALCQLAGPDSEGNSSNNSATDVGDDPSALVPSMLEDDLDGTMVVPATGGVVNEDVEVILTGDEVVDALLEI